MTTVKTILIAEDSDVDRDSLCAVLRKNKFNVVLAKDGEECLDLVAKSKPDMLLLDIILPKVSGNDVLRALRKKYNTIDLPILVVTVKSKSADIVESLTLGANDYITKPVDFDVALMRIKTHLQIADLSRELSRFKEVEAINALIATYNHEINNPLSVAIGALRRLQGAQPESEYEKVNRALWKITSIVKAIKDVAQSGRIEFNKYTNKSKTIKFENPKD